MILPVSMLRLDSNKQHLVFCNGFTALRCAIYGKIQGQMDVLRASWLEGQLDRGSEGQREGLMD